MSEHQPDPDERRDSIVVDGDDPDHVLPPQELDPFTPEPDPPARAKGALRLALPWSWSARDRDGLRSGALTAREQPAERHQHEPREREDDRPRNAPPSTPDAETRRRRARSRARPLAARSAPLQEDPDRAEHGPARAAGRSASAT